MNNSHARHYPHLAGLSFTDDIYFQAAWDLRGAVFDDMISQGETCLPRLLARFADIERHQQIACDLDNGILTGTFRYAPRAAPPSCLDRLETWQAGVLRGADVQMPGYVGFDTATLLADLADGADTVFELGAGYGLQLFRLYHAGGPAKARYVAGDNTPAGLDLGRRLAAFEPGLRFETRPFDFNAPDWSALVDSRKALIFTHWSLMYAQTLSDSFFSSLAQWPGEATLAFIEPIGFQFGSTHDLSLKQAEASASGRLNANFHKALSAAAAAGLIEPLVVAKDVFAVKPEAFDLISVVVCHKPAR